MEDFRKRVERRIVCLIAVVVFCIIFSVVSLSNPDLVDNQVAGFQLGIVVGLGTIMSVEIFKLRRALQENKRLQQLFNREQDERLRYIRSKAGQPMLMVNSVILLLAAIIAGYQNILVFYTLVAVAVFQLTLGACIKIFYMKTM